jgi:hypothetical protein
MWYVKYFVIPVMIEATGIACNSLKMSGNNTRTTFNGVSTKDTILGTSRIMRKVLQSETWSLSGRVLNWLKRIDMEK